MDTIAYLVGISSLLLLHNTLTRRAAYCHGWLSLPLLHSLELRGLAPCRPMAGLPNGVVPDRRAPQKAGRRVWGAPSIVVFVPVSSGLSGMELWRGLDV